MTKEKKPALQWTKPRKWEDTRVLVRLIGPEGRVGEYVEATIKDLEQPVTIGLSATIKEQR